MCIIVDTSVASDLANRKQYLEPVGRYLLKGGKIVINSLLFGEYPLEFRKVVVELKRVGRVLQFDNCPLPSEIAERMMSNDTHVVSLVRKSKARVVCTKDDNLVADLKNRLIINSPRCSIYKHEGARRILPRCCP